MNRPLQITRNQRDKDVTRFTCTIQGIVLCVTHQLHPFTFTKL